MCVSNVDGMKVVHVSTRSQNKTDSIDSASPTQDILQKTSALISALRTTGCHGPLHEPTV